MLAWSAWHSRRELVGHGSRSRSARDRGARAGRFAMTRSPCVFLRGARGAVCTVSMASAANTASNASVYCASRCRREIPCLLHRPVPGRVGSHPSDVQVPCAMLKKHQRVQASAKRGIDGEEVCCDDALGLGGKELAPGRSAAARRRGDARRVQDLPDRRGGDPLPESGHLSLNPPMAPARILAGQPQHQRFDRRPGGRASGAPTRGVVPLRGGCLYVFRQARRGGRCS